MTRVRRKQRRAARPAVAVLESATFPRPTRAQTSVLDSTKEESHDHRDSDRPDATRPGPDQGRVESNHDYQPLQPLLLVAGVGFRLRVGRHHLVGRLCYITFTPGQFKVCEEIGGGEQVYSTDGMTLQKQRSDFFRHYVLGLGSGDLIVRTTGAQAHQIDLPNVLFINAKLRQIENLLKTKNVVAIQ